MNDSGDTEEISCLGSNGEGVAVVLTVGVAQLSDLHSGDGLENITGLGELFLLTFSGEAAQCIMVVGVAGDFHAVGGHFRHHFRVDSVFGPAGAPESIGDPLDASL